jgi:hypothetical protein
MFADDLVHFPEIRRQTGMQNRAIKKVCERFGIPWLQLNSRVLALRRSHFEALLNRASQREAA